MSADPIQITVRGEHEMLQPPERGTVHARLGVEAASAAEAHHTLAASAQRVHASLSALHDRAQGPVTWWSADQVRTWARRPFHDKGKQLPLVHHGVAGLSAKFSDFGALTRWLGESAAVAGFEVTRIEWTLTEARRAGLVREARQQAVRDARRKAQDYADALELGEVRLVAVAEAGMLGEGLHPQSPAVASFSRRAGAESAQEVPLAPEDVELSARVDARFTVG